MAKSRDFKEYDDLGVRFIYPTNWTVQTETWDRGTYGVSVDSPEGSFWSVAIFPQDVDLDEAAKEILSQLHAEYDQLEEGEIERVVADCILDGYEINFFYLDLTSTAQALKFEDGERGYVIFWQTCDRLAITGESLSRVDVFDVMTHTLICNLTGQDVDFWEDEEDEYEVELSEKEAKAEEDREFYRRKYEEARREIQNRYWRYGGTMTGANSGLGDFIEDRSGSGARRGKNDRVETPRNVAQSDERVEDFLRDDDDDDEIRENLVDDGFERAGYEEEEFDDDREYREYDDEESDFDDQNDEDYDRSENDEEE